MLAPVLSLLFINIQLCRAYITQQEFCKSAVVVRAKILPSGSLDGQAPKPTVPRFFRLFELKIQQVYKDNLSSGWDKESVHYAISKDTTWNPDADGCEIPASDKAIDTLLYFDSLDMVKRTCKRWKDVSAFEKKALKKDLYDCRCDLDLCFDPVSRLTGKLDCDSKRRNMAICTLDGGTCVWKGSKKTCVACNRNSPRNSVDQCGSLWG